MNNKIISKFAAAAVLTVCATVAFAHNGIEHLMGTLISKSDSFVVVDTVKHTKVTVMLDPSTTFSFDDKKASVNDLKIGDRVVVNAKEDGNQKLHGISVRWGANSTAAGDHDEHKK
jgi:Cu/Ag efflux protein CusF